MEKLTPTQLKTLNERCNVMPLGQIKRYITSGQVDFPEDLPALAPGRRRELESMLSSQPNPGEQADWEAVSASLPYSPDDYAGMQRILDVVERYIDRWQSARPMGHHVEEAIKVQNDLIDSLADLRIAKETEVNRNRLHEKEWRECCEYSDLMHYHRYIQTHPDSPFIEEARRSMEQFRQYELDRMHALRSAYDPDRMLEIVDAGIITEQQLVMAGIISYGDIENIRNANQVREELPDIMEAIGKCRNEVADNATDVYFLGVPSTGKSCILMGLTQSNYKQFHCNFVKAGGAYASVLNQYLESGITVGRTPGDFIATIFATVADDEDSDTVHNLNLVEMSGEEFAFKLAGNEDGHVRFEDMGTGASQLLCNDNRKIFFIIIDPTTTMLNFMHEQPVKDVRGRKVLNAEGRPVMEAVRCNINQRLVLRKMLDVITDRSNAEIMKKVDAIHFIVTKADVLDDANPGCDRETEAHNRFMANFGHEINRLTAFCKKNGINSNARRDTDGHPFLFTFSLGKFRIGGTFKYDSTDSDKLVEVMRSYSGSVRSKRWREKLMSFLSKPRF